MTTFHSVNVSMGPMDMSGEATTPTAPRAPMELPSRPVPIPTREEAGATTPTRNSFAAANGKRALPVSPFQSTFPESNLPAPEGQSDGVPRSDSQRNSMMSQDTEIANSDDDEVSDGESVGDENGRPSKKKKGQRFYCTEYPPCSLSFTRSEHLARHIRKHTGERPFQCHCSRRFSRLDNLRQHAQTVHVNEEIPGDSLAATGTRFQRQIRTDRVRPPGRSRASTGGASGPHGRGHSRNLSTSSIASTASNMSAMSTMSQDISQRRPHSLSLAEQHAHHGGLTLDTMHTPGAGGYRFGTRSPAEGSTPTSNSYANTPSSPFSSTLGSPISMPRHSGSWAERPSSRRLSVPSGANPFLHNQPHGGFHPTLPHNPLNPTNSSFNSSNSSLMTSPTNSVYSFSPKDALTSAAAAEAEWRRRTWHSSTYNNYNQARPATSGLSFSQTPDAPRPAFAPQAIAAASQTQRLPGFETFDQISQRPLTPTNSRPSGPAEAQPVTPQRPGLYSTSSDRGVPGPHDRRGHASLDLSLHQNLTKLDITSSNTPPKDSFMWPRSEPQGISHAPVHQPPGAFRALTAQSSQSARGIQSSQPAGGALPVANLELHPPSSSRDPGATPHAHPANPTRAKRAGWYNGPPATPSAPAPPPLAGSIAQAITTPGKAHSHTPQPQQPQPQDQPSQHPQQHHQPHRRRSPEDSSSSDGVPTPSSTTLEYQPGIVHPNGFVEAQNPPAPKPVTNFSHPFTAPNPYHGAQPANRLVASPQNPDLCGLDALVAAAESEGKAGTTSQQR